MTCLAEFKTVVPKAIQQAAIDQLGCYPVEEILCYVPTPKLMINDVNSEVTYRNLFCRLIEHEVRTMRRSVFKGTGISLGGERVRNLPKEQDSLEIVRQYHKNFIEKLMSHWNADDSSGVPLISGALRSTFTFISMLCTDEILQNLTRKYPHQLEYEIAESFMQRMLDSALIDLVPYDVPSIVDLCVHWTTFFKAILRIVLPFRITTWLEAENEFQDKSKKEKSERVRLAREEIIQAMLNDFLISKFTMSKSSNVKMNLLIAAVSIVLSITQLGIPKGGHFAAYIVQLLMDRYAYFGRETSFDTVKGDNDIQKTVFYAMGFLVQILSSSGDPLMTTVISSFDDYLAADKDDDRTKACIISLCLNLSCVETLKVPNLIKLIEAVEEAIHFDFDGRDDRNCLVPISSISGLQIGLSLLLMEQGASAFGFDHIGPLLQKLILSSRNLVCTFLERVKNKKSVDVAPTKVKLIEMSIRFCAFVSDDVQDVHNLLFELEKHLSRLVCFMVSLVY